MDYLLFDERAIYAYVTSNSLQNAHGKMGMRFISYLRGEITPRVEEGEIFESTIVYTTENGLIFSGKSPNTEMPRLYCIDLSSCQIMLENDESLLNALQKSLRTALKKWHNQPFSFSERVSGTKIILFPFINPDKRRLVIEREPILSADVRKLVDYPLLAYKYSDEDAPNRGETPSCSVMEKAILAYQSSIIEAQKQLSNKSFLRNKETIGNKETLNRPFQQIVQNKNVSRFDFPFRSFEEQSALLTEAQKKVVFDGKINTPLRVEGAAGTGKTCSLVMRAYWLLNEHARENAPFQIIFFSHNTSTNLRNEEMFRRYPNANDYLNHDLPQSIRFTTLMDFCIEIADFSVSQIPDRDAGETKYYQKLLINSALDRLYDEKKIQVFLPNLSWEMQEVFDPKLTQRNALVEMLKHEFSVQIKGRTNGTIESYKKLNPIANGLPCCTDIDKDLVYEVYLEYQRLLEESGDYDLDDVTMEAMSRLNAPRWRRERTNKGFDYLLIDEMHLFNINEKSVFHFLTKDITRAKQPFCFALDYGQIIGDQGEEGESIYEDTFQSTGTVYDLVFRNSPSILRFCSSIAASGIIMFESGFKDPYQTARSVLSDDGDTKNSKPDLFMYPNENRMLKSLKKHIQRIKKELQCKECEIAIISFDEKYSCSDGPAILSRATGNQIEFIRLSAWNGEEHKCPVASPYDVNGMEFKAVILLGVDEGRVPQTTGTSDISKHFVLYTAFNLLYLTSSRAFYKLLILGNSQNDLSSCLRYSIADNTLEHHNIMDEQV